MHCPQGEPLVSFAVTGMFTVAVQYENAVNAESDWSCESASVAITFTDGSTLQDGAGLTVGP